MLTMKVFGIIGLVWMALFLMGSVLFFRGASSESVEAASMALPLTPASPGTDVRLEGTVAPSPDVTSPVSQRPCVAAMASFSYVRSYTDSGGHPQTDWQFIASRAVGPDPIPIDTGGERIALPRAHWTLHAPVGQLSSSTTQTLDPRWSLAPDEIEAARVRGRSSGRFIGYGVSEWVLTAGQNVFIAGHLEADASPHAPPRLVPATGQGEVMVFLGTQAELVASLRGGSSGLRIAGSIFVVLALVPLAIWVLIARRRGAQPLTIG